MKYGQCKHAFCLNVTISLFIIICITFQKLLEQHLSLIKNEHVSHPNPVVLRGQRMSIQKVAELNRSTWSIILKSDASVDKDHSTWDAHTWSSAWAWRRFLLYCVFQNKRIKDFIYQLPNTLRDTFSALVDKTIFNYVNHGEQHEIGHTHQQVRDSMSLVRHKFTFATLAEVRLQSRDLEVLFTSIPMVQDLFLALLAISQRDILQFYSPKSKG